MNTHDDLLNNDEMCSFYEDDTQYDIRYRFIRLQNLAGNNRG